MTSTATTTVKAAMETPFLTGARKSGSSAQFWQDYVNSRPNPPESFFELITDYHNGHGDSRKEIAHDIGTGPGNIAARLATYFNHVVGSDINDGALEAAPAVVSGETLKRMTLIHSPAEALPDKTPADVGGNGTTDLVTVSECMPLLDAPATLKAIRAILRPGGTMAIYFYGPAIFADGDVSKCNQIYDKIATRICTFNQPMKGTPGFPFHLHAGEALLSQMDSLAIPGEEWESIKRYKWNCDHSLLFNSKAGFDFDWSPVDRRQTSEETIESTDRTFWEHHWTVDDIKSYLDSVYPNWSVKAGAQAAALEPLFEELKTAMGNEKRKVTFPTVLILATKKEPSEMPAAKRVRLSPERTGLGRISESTQESFKKAEELLQINHDQFHIFWRDLNGHNHMAHSILTHFALGASLTELQRANDDGLEVQRAMPEPNSEIIKGLSDEKNLRAIFGELPHYTNALVFFTEQIDLYGWQAVLHKYCFSRTALADIILARMYEGAHHPFIHLGLGVEFGLPSIVAEGLAQAVVHPYSGIPDCLLLTDQEAQPLQQDETHKALLDLYTDARANEAILNGARWEDGPFKMRDGTLTRSKSEIIALASQYRVRPAEMELRAAEVINCSALIAGACQRADKEAKIDFFHMHNVTSSVFLTVLIQDPLISLENKVRLVEWKARTDLFWYAAQGCPKFDIQEIIQYQPRAAAGMGWSELYKAINVMTDDGHVAKFVRALKSAEHVCNSFEKQDPPAFSMTGEGWVQLARMAYDSTVSLPTEAKWPFGVGFDQAWAAIPARVSAKPKGPPGKAMVFPSLTKKFHKTVYEAIDPKNPLISAASKHVVVTGGGSGIGAATAFAFAQAGAASVTIMGRRLENLEDTRKEILEEVPNAQIHVFSVDTTNKEQVNSTFETLAQRIGKVDVLINNAGYKPTVKPTHTTIAELDVEEWWRCFEVNVKGTFNVTQAFLRCNTANATVVYVTSGLSHLPSMKNSSGYAVSKAAGVKLHDAIQAEHPDLRVVSVHPGIVMTMGKVRDAKVAGTMDDASLSSGFFVWLSSSEGAFLKGKYAWANWDVTEMKERAEEIAKGDLLAMKLGGWPFPYKSA